MEFEIYFDLYYLKYDIPKWISRLLLHFALNRMEARMAILKEE